MANVKGNELIATVNTTRILMEHYRSDRDSGSLSAIVVSDMALYGYNHFVVE